MSEPEILGRGGTRGRRGRTSINNNYTSGWVYFTFLANFSHNGAGFFPIIHMFIFFWSKYCVASLDFAHPLTIQYLPWLPLLWPFFFWPPFCWPSLFWPSFCWQSFCWMSFHWPFFCLPSFRWPYYPGVGLKSISVLKWRLYPMSLST
jgi:hypothetical protein